MKTIEAFTDYPSGSSEPPTIEILMQYGMIEAIEFIIKHRVRFRHAGEKNTMLWWIGNEHSGADLASLIELINSGELA